VNRKKKPPITSTKHVMKREYCKLWNSTAGSLIELDDTLANSENEPLALVKCELFDGAKTTFRASEI
jgi:hypothetical protein